MPRITRVLPLVAGVMLSAPAAAQDVDPALEAMVVDWIATEGGDFSDIVKDYGAFCIAPVLSALPEGPRQVFVTAGGIEAGIANIQANDAATAETLMPALQECIETMFVGETVNTWLQSEGAAASAEARRDEAFCYMEAVRPLPTELKQQIVQSPDFETGAGAVVDTGGTVGTALGERLEACG